MPLLPSERSDPHGPDNPLQREGRARRIVPFAAVAFSVFATVPFYSSGEDDPTLAWAALGLTVVILISIITVPWERLPPAAGISVTLSFVVVVFLLRHSEGGARSGLSAVYLLPVVGAALYGTRRELTTVIAAIGIAMLLPILWFGSPLYPGTEWRRAGFFIAPIR